MCIGEYLKRLFFDNFQKLKVRILFFSGLFLTGFIPQSFATDARINPSFDCHSEISPTQTVICDSKVLSLLDFELSKHISGLRQLLTRTQYLVEARTFVEKRDNCIVDAGCIQKIYEARLWKVRARVGDLHRLEGSWVSKTNGQIKIVKIGDVYQFRSLSLASIESYCVSGNSESISRSIDIDAWDMEDDEVQIQWANSCAWSVRLDKQHLVVSETNSCSHEDQVFLGAYRKGEPNNLDYVCFDLKY